MLEFSYLSARKNKFCLLNNINNIYKNYICCLDIHNICHSKVLSLNVNEPSYERSHWMPIK